jgi:hypothetical protein
VIVAVFPVGMVQVAADDEVDVIAVGNPFVTTRWSMGVVRRVLRTFVRRSAAARVRAAGREPMLVDVSVVSVVEVTVMEIVGVAFVGDGSMTAAIPVLVRVSGVLLACHGVLPPHVPARWDER